MKTQGADARRECGDNLTRLVAEASRALTHLNAERLEEMALSCEALVGGSERPEKCEIPEPWNAQGDMAIFQRVLEATRANLKVMRRLREMRMAELYDHAETSEYGNH